MKHLLLFAALLAFTNAFASETIVLSPTDDMYTDAEHAGTPPVATELWTAHYEPAGHFERIMMRFDISPYVDRELESAALHLTRFYSCPSSGTTAAAFYAIDQEWNESSWDHTTHIVYNENIYMPYVFSGEGGNVLTAFDVDMTSFLANWFTSGESNCGFLIMANSGNKFSKFYSNEISNENYRPTLTLVLADVGVTDHSAPQFVANARNYPNPFNPSTTIRFELTEPGDICIDVYDATGRHVRNLQNGHLTAGEHQKHWSGDNKNGEPAPSGVYFYRIKSDRGSFTKSMVMIK